MGVSTTVIEVEIDADRERQREKDMDADTYIDEKGIPRRKSADALRKSKEAAASTSDRPTGGVWTAWTLNEALDLFAKGSIYCGH